MVCMGRALGSGAVISWGYFNLDRNFAFQEISRFLRSVNKEVCDTEQLRHAMASQELDLSYSRYTHLTQPWPSQKRPCVRFSKFQNAFSPMFLKIDFGQAFRI